MRGEGGRAVKRGPGWRFGLNERQGFQLEEVEAAHQQTLTRERANSGDAVLHEPIIGPFAVN